METQDFQKYGNMRPVQLSSPKKKGKALLTVTIKTDYVAQGAAEEWLGLGNEI